MSAVSDKNRLPGATSSTTSNTLSTVLFGAVVLAALIIGWTTGSDSLMTPEEGWGYALGIIGGSAMVLLLLYPLRKYARWMRNTGPIKHWFRIHMILGVLGPVLVLFHANFSTGALNSNLALFATLLVASSGLFGRYIYTRIHFGLYGRKATLASLREAIDSNKDQLSSVLNDVIKRRLAAHEAMALKPRTPISGILALPLISLHRMQTELRARFDLRRHIASQAHISHWDRGSHREILRVARFEMSRYLDLVDKCAGFQAHERLFSFWHLLHLPLFIVMVITGIVHVFAVHLY